MSNAEVRGTTGCLPLSHLVTNGHLRLFGHIARSSPREDDHRDLMRYLTTLSDEYRSLGRRYLVNAYEVEAGIGVIAGNTV